ncbi:hypothetical protein Scep_007598 [Stephania cephalantha]|uniref:Uncharacterized protein n=1 Tax=Stephania cephalantha TaxID=152367 RepID=A0AAP0PQ72_9MAGN
MQTAYDTRNSIKEESRRQWLLEESKPSNGAAAEAGPTDGGEDYERRQSSTSEAARVRAARHCEVRVAQARSGQRQHGESPKQATRRVGSGNDGASPAGNDGDSHQATAAQVRAMAVTHTNGAAGARRGYRRRRRRLASAWRIPASLVERRISGEGKRRRRI